MDRLAKGTTTRLDALWLDPSRVFQAAGMTPDPWQAEMLCSPSPRVSLLCSRQAGKSTVAAGVALKTALLEAPALVLVVSPSERQSGEVIRKVREFYDAVRRKRRPETQAAQSWYEKAASEAGKDADWFALPGVARESALQLHLSNGSRVIGLPGMESTIRCYSSVGLIVIDEASRVDDALYNSVRPMLAVSGGRMLALSTPFGRRGWFHEIQGNAEKWHRVRVPARQCPRISAEFLAEERRALGPRWYAQEYECSFEDLVGGVFSGDSLASLLTPAVAAVPFPES